MFAVFLLIPFLLIRFPLLSHFSKNALSRAVFCTCPRKRKDGLYDLSIEQSSLVHNFFFA